MLGYRPLHSLTLDEARILLDPSTLGNLFYGVNLTALPNAGNIRLIEALGHLTLNAGAWRERLAGLHVATLDINLASASALARAMHGREESVALLLSGRPYFSIDSAMREDPVLGETLSQATPYLAHEGYWFEDKPQGTLVELLPKDTGVMVRYRRDSDLVSLRAVLHELGLDDMGHDPRERLLLCRWGSASSERSAHRFRLKHHDMVETLAPVLADSHGQERFIYPDRLDLALFPDADERDWEGIMRRYTLKLVESYRPGYGSLRVVAHPHDLGALYRTLRALVNEPTVHYIEPTYALF